MDMTSLKCANLVDAMGRMHRHRCHILDLVSPTPGRTLFGQAVTISYFPSCSADLDPTDCTLANLFYEPVGGELTGEVIVLASNGYTDTSTGGGTKLLRLLENAAIGHRRTSRCPNPREKNAICDYEALDPQARERTELQGLRRC
jgi:4-hydroxy-4-methyl-2-oxoglutarate aldolase